MRRDSLTLLTAVLKKDAAGTVLLEKEGQGQAAPRSATWPGG